MVVFDLAFHDRPGEAIDFAAIHQMLLGLLHRLLRAMRRAGRAQHVGRRRLTQQRRNEVPPLLPELLDQ